MSKIWEWIILIATILVMLTRMATFILEEVLEAKLRNVNNRDISWLIPVVNLILNALMIIGMLFSFMAFG